MKRLTLRWAVVGGVVVLLACGVAWFGGSSRVGRAHVWTLSPAPAFLRDDVALDKAAEAMRDDGYDLEAWRPIEDRRTKAPDGTEDVYLIRNAVDPNRGYVEFINPYGQGASRQRSVLVELKGGVLECRVIVGK